MTDGNSFGQLVEYVTVDGIFDVPLLAHDLTVLPTLEAIKGDFEKVATLGRAKVVDTAALKAEMAGVYHADVLENEVVSTNPAQIVGRLAWVRNHPEWFAGAVVAIDDIYLYAGNLYRAVQAHTSQSDWTPVVARALWAHYYESDEVPAWVQPVGSHDVWRLGARVTHNGHTWVSNHDANSWEPGAPGSEALWTCEDCEPSTAEWAVGVAYKVNDQVTYNGRLYKCLQAHTSISTWYPSAPGIINVLWQDIGAAP